MNPRIFYAGLPLAVTLLAAGASAQSVVTIDRPLQLTQNQQTTVTRTTVRESAVPQARKAARKQSKQTSRKPARIVRTTTTERIVSRPAPIARQRLIPPVRDVVVGGPLDLTPDQQTIVYRTLRQQPIQPAPVLTERIVVSAPGTRPFVTSEPDTIVATDQYGRRVMTAPETMGAGTVMVEQQAGNIAIGSRLPASIPLYVMPPETAAAVPSIEPYRYALVGDRVYLVDPRDGIVVGMLYQ